MEHAFAPAKDCRLHEVVRAVPPAAVVAYLRGSWPSLRWWRGRWGLSQHWSDEQIEAALERGRLARGTDLCRARRRRAGRRGGT